MPCFDAAAHAADPDGSHRSRAIPLDPVRRPRQHQWSGRDDDGPAYAPRNRVAGDLEGSAVARMRGEIVAAGANLVSITSKGGDEKK